MILSATLRGIEARPVRVTATRRAGPAALRIDGIAGAAERETRVRVTSALYECGHPISDDISVAIDAARGAIDGASLDLAVALAIVTGGAHGPIEALGELALTGEVRPGRGVLAAVEALAPHASHIFVPHENVAEAALAPSARIVGIGRLKDALDYLAGEHIPAAPTPPVAQPGPYPDLRDVVGEPHARRALEIAAAGPHNLLLIGSPGAGNSMLARRLPGILPPMTEAEALDVTRVHSAAGLNVGGGLVTTRPFRAPHHSTTAAGLVGGGASVCRPGEVSLATNGVLFLDDLPEFARASIEALREPVATGEVVLCRASGTVRLPARCIVVASMMPCPCGYAGTRRCRCVPPDIARYRARIPSILLDLFDVRVPITPTANPTLSGAEVSEESATVRTRVLAARRLTARQNIDPGAHRLLARSLERGATPRATHDRAARVAATIARLGNKDAADADDAVEAIALACDPQ